jgi:hypothetical protein
MNSSFDKAGGFHASPISTLWQGVFEATREKTRISARTNGKYTSATAGLIATVVGLQEVYSCFQYAGLVQFGIRWRNHSRKVIYERVELVPAFLFTHIPRFSARYAKEENR